LQRTSLFCDGVVKFRDLVIAQIDQVDAGLFAQSRSSARWMGFRHLVARQFPAQAAFAATIRSILSVRRQSARRGEWQ